MVGAVLPVPSYSLVDSTGKTFIFTINISGSISSRVIDVSTKLGSLDIVVRESHVW